MIEKVANTRSLLRGEFLDHHTSETMILVSLLLPKFARDPSTEARRTSEAGH
jgi:hypothetical protein